MMVRIFVYIFAVFDVWLFTYFLRGNFKRRFEEKWKNNVILLIGSVLLILINTWQNAIVNLIGGLALFLLVAVTVYKGKIQLLIVCETLYYIVAASMEGVATLIMVTTSGTQAQFDLAYDFIESPMYIVIAKMMIYLAILLIDTFLRRKQIGKYGYSLLKAIFLPVTTLILMIGIQLSFDGSNTVMIIGAVMLLFTNVLMFYCIDEMIVAQEKNKEYELQNTENAMKEAYYRKMEEISTEHRKYIHNLKDCLQTIGGLAAQGKTDGILGLLNEMETEIELIGDNRYTGNDILNALLCEKEYIARKEGIKIQIETATYLKFSFAKPRDLIVMVGNLLDNAIEAAGKCTGDKEINVCFATEQGNFETIQIDNTYNGTCNMEGEKFLSTKQEMDKHGFGIESVKKTAQKYGGILLVEPKENIFTTILTLSKVYYKEE